MRKPCPGSSKPGMEPPRFSLLPVGAYEPQWFMQYAHMKPAEAVQTYLDLGEGYAMGTQHEVFAMADEAYAAPRQTLSEALQVKGIDRERFSAPRGRRLVHGAAALIDLPPVFVPVFKLELCPFLYLA